MREREREREEARARRVMKCVLTTTALKKVKHRLVEKMKESAADTLGLSRAVLVNGQWLCPVVEWTV